jgi:hypothetical protein
MTEEEWKACTDPGLMFAFLDPGRPSLHRKMRLVACACVRRAWHLLSREEVRGAVELAESHADGLIGREKLRPGWSAIRKALSMAPLGTRWEHVLMAALHATTPEHANVGMAALAVVRALNDDWQEWRIDPAEGRSPWEQVCNRDRAFLCDLLRDLFEYVYHPVTLSRSWLNWNDGTVVRLAKAAYDDRILPAGTLDNARLAILADALEEAGCADELVLGHLRNGGEHYRGCFVVDALLSKPFQ